MATNSFWTVFDTVELFESVLSQLTLTDLLLAQRVNRHWQHTITTSPTLQQKLFFHPEPHSHLSTPKFNPLLQSLFPALFKIVPRASWEAWDFDGWGPGRRNSGITWDASRTAILRPDASWRKMFPVQPPAKIAYVQEEVPCCTRVTWENVGAFSAEFERLQEVGVRMGLLYDLVMHLVDGIEYGVVLIDWKMVRPIPEGQGGGGLDGFELEEEEDDEDAEDWSNYRPMVDDGEDAVNEIHVGFANTECQGRNPGLQRSALTIRKFDKDLISWSMSKKKE